MIFRLMWIYIFLNMFVAGNGSTLHLHNMGKVETVLKLQIHNNYMYSITVHVWL